MIRFLSDLGRACGFRIRDWLFASFLAALTLGVPVGLAIAIVKGALR